MQETEFETETKHPGLVYEGTAHNNNSYLLVYLAFIHSPCVNIVTIKNSLFISAKSQSFTCELKHIFTNPPLLPCLNLLQSFPTDTCQVESDKKV